MHKNSEDPNYSPNNEDMKSDESVKCCESDNSESKDLKKKEIGLHITIWL